MHYLCPSPLSELARLRSIYRWMTSFRLEDVDKDQVSEDDGGRDEATTTQQTTTTTPLEHIQRISAQTTNYAAVFTQLARWESTTIMLDVYLMLHLLCQALHSTVSAARICLHI